MKGALHRFGPAGLRDGLVVLADEETRTYWDHITGEAFEGPLAGERLPVWPMRMTTLAALRAERPAARVQRGGPRGLRERIKRRVMAFGMRRGFLDSPGSMPGFFDQTMRGPVDPRLDRLEQGLGVIEGAEARYYRLRDIPRGTRLADDWSGRRLELWRGEADGVPRAAWADGGDPPMQLLCRWYGFSFTYPGCAIFEPEGRAEAAG